MNEENKQKRSELKEQAIAKLDDSRNRYAKIIAERNLIGTTPTRKEEPYNVGNEPAEWVAEGVFKKSIKKGE